MLLQPWPCEPVVPVSAEEVRQLVFHLGFDGRFDVLFISPELAEWRLVFRDFSELLALLLRPDCIVVGVTEEGGLVQAMRDEFRRLFPDGTFLHSKQQSDDIERAIAKVRELCGRGVTCSSTSMYIN